MLDELLLLHRSWQHRLRDHLRGSRLSAINYAGTIAVAADGNLYSVKGIHNHHHRHRPSYDGVAGPSINQAGVVADVAGNSAGDIDYVITERERDYDIADSSNLLFANNFYLSHVGADVWVNNSGEVAFAAGDALAYGDPLLDWIGDGTTLTELPEATDAAFESGSPSINDSGVVAYLSNFPSGEEDIDTSTGQVSRNSTTLVRKTTDGHHSRHSRLGSNRHHF